MLNILETKRPCHGNFQILGIFLSLIPICSQFFNTQQIPTNLVSKIKRYHDQVLFIIVRIKPKNNEHVQDSSVCSAFVKTTSFTKL